MRARYNRSQEDLHDPSSLSKIYGSPTKLNDEGVDDLLKVENASGEVDLGNKKKFFKKNLEPYSQLVSYRDSIREHSLQSNPSHRSISPQPQISWQDQTSLLQAQSN
mmetsp:Transcript_1049/g.1932  ORF Transcript_1049/g.1932 Transcript_1049/m.1932 type:complete len:107 (+) Transcript_1049:902-1222(+)